MRRIEEIVYLKALNRKKQTKGIKKQTRDLKKLQCFCFQKGIMKRYLQIFVFNVITAFRDGECNRMWAQI